jgi:phenylalanyl-tRNA synthetase beta chain
MPIRWVSLIATELEKNLDWLNITAYSDNYTNKQETITIPFDLDFINNLIGKRYTENEALNILANLWITDLCAAWPWNKRILTIPFWRKDLNFKADIAEEIARIDGYDNIEATVPRINLWAVIQPSIYKLKNDARNYFTNKWWYDMYTYSFVNEELMTKTLWNTKDLVPMKNALSEELTHLRWSLVPNLLLSLEKNIREYSDMKLFELEKVFTRNGSDINEFYSLAWVELSKNDIAYYDIQNTVSDLFKTLWINSYMFDITEKIPSFAHSGRTASIVVRGQIVWTVWEIHPKVANNFDVNERIWYFEININLLENALYSITKAKDVSSFQENNFDLNFVVNKDIKAKDIKQTIEKTNPNLITKVELFDIYEDATKLAWKRSLVFKIFIQSMDWTLDDKIKNELINEIVKKVEKKWWELR